MALGPLSPLLPGVTGRQGQDSATAQRRTGTSDSGLDAAFARLDNTLSQGNLDPRAPRGTYLNIVV